MARPEVTPLLAKDFILLKIDQDRMTGGLEMVNATKGKSGGIPWFHVLDADGAALGDSNGPKGNIGCPNTDDEIAVFIDLLKKVKLNLTDEEIDTLKKALVAHREKK